MEGKTLRNRALIARMDILQVSDIVDDSHRCILLGGGKLRLRLLDESDIREAPRRKLYKIEREVRILELGCPAIVESLHLVCIAFRFTRVGATLVPDETAYGHRRVGCDHSVPECGRLLVSGTDRSLRHGRLPVLLGNHLPVAFDIESGKSLVAGTGCPCVDVCAAPRRIDKADRDVERISKFESIVVAHSGRHRLSGLPCVPKGRRHLHPLNLDIKLGFKSHGFGRLYEADKRTIGRHKHHGTPCVTITRALSPDRAIGIGLTGAHPDFTDEHIGNADIVHRKRTSRLACLHRRKLDQPLA